MQTFLLSLAISEPSPRMLIFKGAISLVLLAIFLRHKLGKAGIPSAPRQLNRIGVLARRSTN